MLYYFLLLPVLTVLLFIAAVWIFMQQPQFGKKPEGNRLQRMQKSPRYKNGKFENEHFTPQLSEGYSMPQVLVQFLFKRNPARVPKTRLPVIKTDIRSVPAEQDVFIWFGHSSYYFQADGKRFLVDPVFSGNASPVAGSNKSFAGVDVYSAGDFPPIDFLILTHDHYDHLDYTTIRKFREKVTQVICPIGVGAHLEYWKYNPEIITELDWHESADKGNGFSFHAMPARHFSGRGFSRNSTLWASFVLKTPTWNLYIGGDSGYDTHFAEIGKKFGPFDWAFLENGQYDVKWKYIHAQPEEVLQAAHDLQAKHVVPVHSSKFALANHNWQEPLVRITASHSGSAFQLVTPQLGETVDLLHPHAEYLHWWENLD